MNKNGYIIVLTILLFLTLTPVLAELSYDDTFCEDEQKGYELLGSDFYLLCEENLADDYFQGVPESEYMRPIPLLDDEQPPSLEPTSLFEYMVLQRSGYAKENMTLSEELLKAIEEEQPLQPIIQEQHLSTTNISIEELEQNDSMDEQSFSESTQEKEKKEQITREQTNSEETKPSFFQSYLLYLAVGLFMLTGIYIVIHTLLKKHERKQQEAIAYSYVVLLRRKHYSDEQIKQYFLQKGYEEEFINEVLKTQDSKP